MKRHVDALVREALRDAIGRGAARGTGEVLFQVEVPRQIDFGDLACDVGLVLARAVGASPHALATAVVDRLRDPHGWLSEVTVAGPGFVNFRFSLAFWRTLLAEALVAGAAHGLGAQGAGRRALVEVLAPRDAIPCDPRRERATVVARALVGALRQSGWDATDDGGPAGGGRAAARDAALATAVLVPTRNDDVARFRATLARSTALRVLGVQAMRLSRDGEPIGEHAEPASLNEAARFLLLLARADRPVEVDLALAERRETDNPAFLVWYAGDRLARVRAERPEPGSIGPDLGQLDEGDVEVMRAVAAWPDVVEIAGQTLEPDRIARYAVDTAAAVHRWANRYRLLDAAVSPAPARVALAGCVGGVLSRATALCGMVKPGWS